ncbi:MAG TPA: M1 family metallopeptidase [Puia sp.]|nr:M1 family metallopeptidase [Puia sp.]
MKKYLFLFFPLLPYAAFTQYAGDYGTADTTLFQIIERTDGFYFSTEHYGNIRMIPKGKGSFTLDRVNPPITIEFDTNGVGQVTRLLLHQAGKFTWIKDTPSVSPMGVYRQDIDASLHIRVRQEGERMLADTTLLRAIGRDKYRLEDTRLDDTYIFDRDRKGVVKRLIVQRTGVQAYVRRSTSTPAVVRTHAPDRHLGFSRADTLEGASLPARTCYDVLFYDLDVAVDPVERSVKGRNRIRLRAVRDLDSLQLDLYANLRIDSICWRWRNLVNGGALDLIGGKTLDPASGRRLDYRRELNAVYVKFPAPVAAGTVGEIEVVYEGKPILPDPSVLQGGVIWFRDAKGKPWAETVCQGSGGSLWWPGKDLLSDKPDSMRIVLTVPAGLMGISNGRLLDTTTLPDGRRRWVWYVSYPIINYDVAFYIGDYVHWRDSVGYDYYCMPYSEEKARRLFAGVPAMMRLYEKDFGPYPFARDGFKLVEAPYPMEHQSAVTPGPITPLGDGPYDTAETTRTLWHESAHEWWGNSVSCADFADLWIHEAFATYGEQLSYDAFGKGDERYVRNEEPANKEPIIGVYGVNYFYLGDMYSKGARMLRTLQHVVGDDSIWFGALRGIQERLRYGSVTTEEVIHWFNTLAGADYTPVFDQYLRHTGVPALQWRSSRPGVVEYRWKVDVPGFSMPVKVNGGQVLPATEEWKEVRMEGEMKVDTAAYYIQVLRTAP